MKQTLKFIWYATWSLGYALLWLQYYWPKEWGKERNVAKTGRQWRNRHVMAPIYTIGTLLFIFIILSGQ